MLGVVVVYGIRERCVLTFGVVLATRVVTIMCLLEIDNACVSSLPGSIGGAKTTNRTSVFFASVQHVGLHLTLIVR